MEPNEIIFGKGFFENLSYYRKFGQEHQPEETPEEIVPEARKKVPNWIRPTEEDIGTPKNDFEQREEQIANLTGEVIPLRDDLSRLQAEYSVLVERSLVDLRNTDICEPETYTKNSHCSKEYSSLAKCIRASPKNIKLVREKNPDQAKVARIFCVHERLAFKQCAQRQPNWLDSGFGIRENSDLVHRLADSGRKF
ncbi:unnamed protein product [Moneuplotes crassus]|uniref:Uncharacterized protein n=1 Tax=Euplotes crassus TaxID=5936 RepID=A0AAD2D5K7_EUPCR|nr:unnamed protein product [Moneuplotes crassus]